MTSSEALLDTDVLLGLLNKHPKIVTQSQLYLPVYHQFTLSVMTRYEILRGFKVRGTPLQPYAWPPNRKLADLSNLGKLSIE